VRGARNALQHKLIVGHPFGRFHHQHRDVRSLECGARGTVHRLVECAARLGMQAGRVHERDLRLGQGEHAQNAVARGLRTRRDDAQLVPDERIEKRRLADVRPSHQRSVSAAKLRR